MGCLLTVLQEPPGADESSCFGMPLVAPGPRSLDLYVGLVPARGSCARVSLRPPGPLVHPGWGFLAADGVVPLPF